MVPERMIDANIYPSRNAYASKKIEKEFLLFSSTKAGHVCLSPTQEITNYLDYAEKIGSEFDWVQLHSGDIFNHSPLEKYPNCGFDVDEKTNCFIDEAISVCKARGKKVCYMIGNLTPLDSLLEAYPEVRNLHNGLFFELIHDVVCGIFKRFPTLDEVGFYFFECPTILHYTNFFRNMHYGHVINEDVMKNHRDIWADQEAHAYPYLTDGDHLRLISQAAAQACKECGKTFRVLTHVWFPFQEEMLYEAFRDFPTDLPLLLEHNYTTGDFNPHLPAPGLIRRLPHLHHAIVFCCGMEYHGLGLVPCCFPEDIQAVIHQAMEETPNLDKIVIRPVWDGFSALNTPNEINVFTVLRSADQPKVDTDDLWDEWIQMKYGLTGDNALKLADALRKSYKVVSDVFFEFGIRANDHSHIPAFHHLESRLHNYGKAIKQWASTPQNRQNVHDLLVNPGRKILRLQREKHEDALKLIKEALSQVNDLREFMKEEDINDICRRYEDMYTWVTLHEDEYDAYVRLLIHRRNPSPENTAAAAEAMARLKMLTDKIRSGEIRNNYLFSLDHVDDFVNECSKQFGI